MKILLRCALFFFLFYSSTTSASWYGGINLGFSSSDISQSDYYDGGIVTGGSLDESDEALGFHIGHQIIDRFSVELGYIDMGETRYTGISDGSGVFWFPGPIEATAAVNGFTLTANGSFPIVKRLFVTGRLGIFNWKSEESFTDTCCTIRIKDDGNDLVYGLGVQLRFKSFSLNFNADQYTVDIDKERDIFVGSIGASYRF